MDPAGNSTTKTVSFHVLVATQVTATPVVPTVPTLQARLTDSGSTPAPIVGQTIVFTAGQSGSGSQLCTAVTDSNGFATCNNVGAVTTAVVAGGVTATFSPAADTTIYNGSRGSAGVV
jgi:hypothetical protein